MSGQCDTHWEMRNVFTVAKKKTRIEETTWGLSYRQEGNNNKMDVRNGVKPCVLDPSGS